MSDSVKKSFDELRAERDAAVTAAEKSCRAKATELEKQRATAEAERDAEIAKLRNAFESALESRRVALAAKVFDELKPLCAAFRADDAKIVASKILEKFRELDAESKSLVGVGLDSRAVAVAFAGALIDEQAGQKPTDFTGAWAVEFFARQDTFSYSMSTIGRALEKLDAAIKLADPGHLRTVLGVVESALTGSRATAHRYEVTSLAKDRWELVSRGTAAQLAKFDSEVQKARDEAAAKVNAEALKRSNWAKIV